MGCWTVLKQKQHLNTADLVRFAVEPDIRPMRTSINMVNVEQMGFIWSKPRSPLDESLLQEQPVLLRTGDLLLVPTSLLEITLNQEVWHSVAIVLSGSKVYAKGQILPLREFIQKHENTCVRQLNCQRPAGFETQFVKGVADSMALSYKIEPEFKDGFRIGYVLAHMRFISDKAIERLKPQHFSSATPFKKLDLYMYSENIVL